MNTWEAGVVKRSICKQNEPLIIELASEGMQRKEICEITGIKRKTLDRFLSSNPHIEVEYSEHWKLRNLNDKQPKQSLLTMAWK